MHVAANNLELYFSRLFCNKTNDVAFWRRLMLYFPSAAANSGCVLERTACGAPAVANCGWLTNAVDVDRCISQRRYDFLQKTLVASVALRFFLKIMKIPKRKIRLMEKRNYKNLFSFFFLPFLGKNWQNQCFLWEWPNGGEKIMKLPIGFFISLEFWKKRHIFLSKL